MSITLESVLGLITQAETGDRPPATEYNRRANFLLGLFQVFLQNVVEDGILRNDPERCGYYYYTNRITRPSESLPIMGLVGGYPMLMGNNMEADGTVSTASTTALIDAGLGGADDFWVRAYILFTSGVNDGQVRRVEAFDATTKQLTWDTALGTAPSPGDTYTVTFFYVTDLTVAATNYIFARKGSDTVDRYIMEFYASTSATPQTNEILVSSAVLDGSGSCISFDDHPTGVARDLWTGVGSYKELTGSGTVEDLAASASVQVTVSHDQLLFLGGLNIELETGYYVYGSIVVDEHHKDDEFKFTITNDSGSPVTFNYTWSRNGRVASYA